MKVLLWLRRFMSIQVMIALAVLMVLVIVNMVFPHTIQSMYLSGLIGAGAIGAVVDAQTQLDFNNALAAAATTQSTNSYDSLLATNNIPAGEPLAVSLNVGVALAGTTPTFQVQVIQSANANLSSPDILVTTDTTFLNAAFWSLGRRVVITIPMNLKTKRYLGLQYVLGGTTPSITISAYIIPENFAQNEQVYPKNFLITS